MTDDIGSGSSALQQTNDTRSPIPMSGFKLLSRESANKQKPSAEARSVLWTLIGLLGLVLSAHIASIGLVALRGKRSRIGDEFDCLPVTLIRPICGLDRIEQETLASSFRLRHPNLEVLFCCETEDDPAVGYVRRLIAANPSVDARILISGPQQSQNPKLTNMAVGWHSARHEWVAFVDSNVMLQPQTLTLLLGTWGTRTGLVCAPPLGTAPENFWAEVECAFLNSHQARWQYAADAVGRGFAQGKMMLWRRQELLAAGGVEALARELAEDAAATKVVRATGRSVDLCDAPSVQPLGVREMGIVIGRQVRWAQLRRLTFPLPYAAEVLGNGLLAIGLAGLLAFLAGADEILVAAVVTAMWYGGELALSVNRGWPVSWWTPMAMLVRDVLLPVIWMMGWTRRPYRWRGRIIEPSPSFPAHAQVDGRIETVRS